MIEKKIPSGNFLRRVRGRFDRVRIKAGLSFWYGPPMRQQFALVKDNKDNKQVIKFLVKRTVVTRV